MKKLICIWLCVLLALSLCGCPEKEPAPDVTGWQLVLQEDTVVCDGVCYQQRRYVDSEEAPFMVYILTVDLQKATLYTGTSQNNYELIPTQRQDVLAQTEASVQDGLDVVAAVNGDFFAIETSYQPSGLCVKNGKLINSNSRLRPYTAITKEGQARICDGREETLDPATLEMAVGGSHVILKDGVITEFGEYDSSAKTSHPRTLAGIKADGSVLLVVIDGRQPQMSNGANLTQSAELMRALGAVTAINHDGGGSSTMLVKTQDQYRVMNSPSDGSLRKVYCSIQVIKK